MDLARKGTRLFPSSEQPDLWDLPFHRTLGIVRLISTLTFFEGCTQTLWRHIFQCAANAAGDSEQIVSGSFTYANH